ncbi:MAG: hypothetical protein EOP42_07740 [Sphingobacteriaceae bacterium]|nr:MAG: hypothetical protein EOP42_07740 [Sphingobacteriaceae bacterium]
MVSLDHYAAINTDFFEVVADLNSWQVNRMQTLPVQLKQQPQYCKIVSMQPAAVNFIVRR